MGRLGAEALTAMTVLLEIALTGAQKRSTDLYTRLAGGRAMTPPWVRLDIDATREKLVALGLANAVDAPEGMLAEAVRAQTPAHALKIQRRSYRLRDLEDAFKA